MALKDIKTKISATKRMHTVTRAMEAVSAVKMRKTQSTALAGRAYARAALSILTRLSGTQDVIRHPLAKVREVKNVALILITSDKGLAGSLNSGVIKRAIESVAPYAVEQVTVYAYGKKGMEFFARRGYKIAIYIENKRDDVALSVMEELSATVVEAFERNTYDSVLAVYSNFKSTFEQHPIARTLLPLSSETLSELVSDIQPSRGKWSTEPVMTPPASYEIEPSDEEIISVLVPRLVAVSLYHMLLEAKASEHSARMVAMKNASDKSKEVARDLTRLFNKIRQAAITREVSEIVGGREALAN
jgi:F-type H+-transporting ATPase subunit gamma